MGLIQEVIFSLPKAQEARFEERANCTALTTLVKKTMMVCKGEWEMPSSSSWVSVKDRVEGFISAPISLRDTAGVFYIHCIANKSQALLTLIYSP